MPHDDVDDEAPRVRIPTRKPKATVTTTQSVAEDANPQEETEVKQPETKSDDMVMISCLRAESPPPIIGHFNFGRQFSITGFKKGDKFPVPRHVGHHLESVGAAVIVA